MQPDIHYQLTDTDGQVTHIKLHQEPESHGLAVDPALLHRGLADLPVLTEITAKVHPSEATEKLREPGRK